jgi:4-amino-4-deoxy-L-arabinose transferase-like glycosyltransferase
MAPAFQWALLLLIVPPREQEFPLHDDALFSRTAIVFARGEGLHYYNWASMPMLGQVVWTAPFLWLLGESQVTLRVATLTLASLRVGAFYDLLRRENGLSLRSAAFMAACLSLNPLFFLLSDSFQTDVPALAFSLLAMAGYVRGLRGGGRGWWTTGMVAALFAVTTRQNAVAAPAAVALLLYQQVGRRRFWWWTAALVPLAVAVAVHFWFIHRPDIWRLEPQFRGVLAGPVLIFVAFHMLGLSALPLMPLPEKRGWRAFVLLLVVFLVMANLLHTIQAGPYGGLFPYLGNWITPWGLFGENSLVPGERPLMLGFAFRLGLTLLGCVLGAVLLARLVGLWPRKSHASALLLFTLLHVPFLLVAPSVYDRYLLVLLPGGLALAAGDEETCHGRIANVVVGFRAVFLTAMAFLSLALSCDLLQWNRALWTLGRRALERNVDPADVEGGFAWNGWFAPEAAVDKTSRPARGLMTPVTPVFFPHVTGRYAISFSRLPGSRVLDAESYRLWLIPGEYQMVLLEADPTSAQLRHTQPVTILRAAP